MLRFIILQRAANAKNLAYKGLNSFTQGAWFNPINTVVEYCKFGNFLEGFIFAETSQLRCFVKINPREMTKSLCRLLMYSNYALVVIFYRGKYVF